MGEGAQVVGGDDLNAVAMDQLGRIVARPRDHVGADRPGQVAQRRGQRRWADLGTAAAAQGLVR